MEALAPHVTQRLAPSLSSGSRWPRPTSPFDSSRVRDVHPLLHPASTRRSSPRSPTSRSAGSPLCTPSETRWQGGRASRHCHRPSGPRRATPCPPARSQVGLDPVESRHSRVAAASAQSTNRSAGTDRRHSPHSRGGCRHPGHGRVPAACRDNWGAARGTLCHPLGRGGPGERDGDDRPFCRQRLERGVRGEGHEDPFDPQDRARSDVNRRPARTPTARGRASDCLRLETCDWCLRLLTSSRQLETVVAN